MLNEVRFSTFIAVVIFFLRQIKAYSKQNSFNLLFCFRVFQGMTSTSGKMNNYEN